MAKDEASCRFSFGSKRSIHMVVRDSFDANMDTCIEIGGRECELGFELSRENLKKLHYLIQERLKGENCHFTEDNILVRHLENRKIQTTPAAEILESI